MLRVLIEVPTRRLTTMHMPSTTEKWLEDRKLKSEPTLNDLVEQLHWKLVSNEKYRSFLEAVWDEDAVEGSLSADNHKAAEMLREFARKDDSNIIGTKKLATIVKALNVVLRRYHKSRKERRHMVAGEIVPNDNNE
jgi:hypothetical protein